MKKIYTLLASLITAISFAQSVPSSTLVNGTFGSGAKILSTDEDKTNLYYWQPSPFTITKVASNNTESVYFKNAMYSLLPGIAIKGNKAIIVTKDLFTPFTKVYLLNGAAKDSLTLFAKTNIAINNNFGYFFDTSSVYKTNFTVAGTNTIVPKRANTIINSMMEKNDKLMTIESSLKLYLYFHDGSSYSKIDSVNTGPAYFQLFKNPTNKDIYAVKHLTSLADTTTFKIWKFSGTGVPTVLNLTTTRRLTEVMTMLNDKLIGVVYSGATNGKKLVSIDVNTGNLTYINSGNHIKTYNYANNYLNWYSNGNVAYFLHQGTTSSYVQCVTNGITADTITTKIDPGATFWKGDFCGDDFWSENGFATIIYSPNKTFKVVSVNNDPLNIMSQDPLFADNHMYFRVVNSSISSYSLYKAACSAQVGINENTISTDNFSIYPNPSAGVLNVELSANFDYAQLPLIITNILGEVVLTEKLSTQNSSTDSYRYNIQHFNSGIYFLQVGNSKAVKFIKE